MCVRVRTYAYACVCRSMLVYAYASACRNMRVYVDECCDVAKLKIASRDGIHRECNALWVHVHCTSCDGEELWN